MPPSDLTDLGLVALVRTIVQSSISEAQAAVRTPRILTGVVEDMDDNLDVVYIRMDQEAMSGDPTLSNNWDAPGVIAATRIGETVIGEQVRVTFNGPTASAQNTSVPTRIVRPFGVETGQRMVFDGDLGTIEFWSDANELVGYLDATQWSIGRPGQSLARLDPLAGLRLRDDNDILRVQLSATEGLIIREPTSGISGLIAADDGLIVLDPDTGERISITSGTTSAVPTPHWAGTEATNPGTSHGTPATTSFDTGDDFDLRFVCAADLSDLGAQSYTPPTGYTERTDVNGSGSGITLATSAATLDPAVAVPGAAFFTNTSSAWDRHNGHSMIIRGGGVSSPTFRSTSSSSVLTFVVQTLEVDISVPAATAEGDLLVACIAMASSQVPIGWTVPEGWKQLGVQVSGLGTPLVLASGVWYKRASASEPSTYHVTINMAGAALTKLHCTAVAVQNPYGYPAGLDIRRNNRSMPRGLVAEVVSTSDSGPWGHGSFPLGFEQLLDVPVLAGRKYRITWDCPIYEFAALDTNCRFNVGIQIDEGAGFVSWHRVQRSGIAGTTRDQLYVSRVYMAIADGTIDIKIGAANENSGAGYTFTVFGAADYRRSLSITDEGAVF